MVKQPISDLEIPLTLTPREREAVTEFVNILRQKFGPRIKGIRQKGIMVD